MQQVLLKARGTIRVDSSKSRIVVEMGSDILDYYNFFISKTYWIRLQKPLHGAHISIALASKHKKVNWQRAEYYDGEEIEFEYDPYLIRGGYTKGFIMFYLKVYSEAIDKIKKELNIVDSEGYQGLHLTIGNTLKSGSKPLLYWPELITIKN